MTLKKNNKYSYISGKQITDVDTGTRFYDFAGVRLPSVTTVLARTKNQEYLTCLLYTSPSPRDRTRSRMPSSA